MKSVQFTAPAASERNTAMKCESEHRGERKGLAMASEELALGVQGAAHKVQPPSPMT